MIRRQILTALVVVVVMTVTLGFVYPFVVTGVAQVAFHSKANDSLVKVNGKLVGSSLLGQDFVDKDGTYVCDPNTVPQRVLAYRQLNGLGANVKVPVDAVTSSASGLDPDISIANADLQAPRVANVRHLPLATVLAQIKAHTAGRDLGFLGEKAVNVLELNLALDKLAR